MRKIVFGLALLLAGCASQAPVSRSGNGNFTLRSPDNKIVTNIDAAGYLTYRTSYNNQPILSDSHLGMRFADGSEIGRDVSVTNVSSRTIDETWQNRLGKNKTVRDHCNELRLSLHEASGKNFDVIFRAYNEGIAFRYVLSQEFGNFVITAEDSQFAFPENFTCFAGDQKGGFKGSQEWHFTEHKLSDFNPQSIEGLPLLVHANNAWALIGEADLRDYAGMWLSGDTRSTLTAKLAPQPDKNGAVIASGPHNSPWRVVMIGDQATDIINHSDIITNLATPNQIGDDSWVQPGMMAWDHWWTGGVKMSNESLKSCIQLAADQGWPYQLIDAGWYDEKGAQPGNIIHPFEKIDLPDLLHFAREKNVRLWLWMNWEDVVRNNTYKEAFPLFEQWGIAGVKIDYWDRDDQNIVNWYEIIAREAAKHHLLVDYHGSFKPGGFQRTFPNQITREGILGNEYQKWSRLCTPQHKLMLPFTRFVEGPADFTPGGFLNRQPSQFKNAVPTQVQGTRGAELSLYVLFDSPVQCNCDAPEVYDHLPGMDFLKVVPTTWDETHALDGVPGQHLTMLRRSHGDYYIGSMSTKPRDVQVKLDFLPAGKYHLKLWRDAADADQNAEHIDIDERQVTRDDVLNVHIAPNGGFVAQLVRE